MKYAGWKLITKDQHLKYGDTIYLFNEPVGRFRCGPVIGVHKNRWPGGRGCWRSQSMAEKRKWYDYEQQLKENGLARFHRGRRCGSHLISTYDDFPHYHYRGSWKQSTKKKRQWGGCIELLYCG